MRRVLAMLAILGVIVCLPACEWENYDESESWDDSYSWANFSGVYRSGSSSTPLVSEFTLASGSGVDVPDPDAGGGTGDEDWEPIGNETVGTVPAGNDKFSSADSTLNLLGANGQNLPLREGSIQISFTGGATGTMVDDGGGNLAGTVTIGGVIQKEVAGTVNYNTGSWSAEIIDFVLGFMSTANVYVSYEYDAASGTTATVTTTTTTDDSEPVTAGGWIYSFHVTQQGNRIVIIDNNNNTYEGKIGRVSTTSGDSTGGSDGYVIANFEAVGKASGRDVRIVGTFEGTYTVTITADRTIGQLTGRAIQGTWIQSNVTADLLGYANDSSVEIQTSTGP